MWLPIDDDTPRDRPIVCWREGWAPCLLQWKTNPRIVSARAQGLDCDGMVDSYFGDSTEMDDYDLAKPAGFPTHWHPLDLTPDEKRPLTD